MTFVPAEAERNTKIVTEKICNKIMIISEKTKEFIQLLQEFKQDSINFLHELNIIIEIANSPGNSKDFDDLIFTAKYLKGLKNILKTGNAGEESQEKITGELTLNVEKLKNGINEILKKSGISTEESFAFNKFFGLDYEHLNNLFLFSDDLAICKEYYNFKGRDK